MDESAALDETLAEIERLRSRRQELLDEIYRLRTAERDARSTNPRGPAEFLTLGAWARLVGIAPRTANEFRARWTGRGFPWPCLMRRGIAYFDRAGLDSWYAAHRRD